MRTKLDQMLALLTSATPTSARHDAADLAPGEVREVDVETYEYMLDVLPPHLIRSAAFCYAEGFAPYALLWRCSSRCFIRQLDWEETRLLARLASIPLPGAS